MTLLLTLPPLVAGRAEGLAAGLLLLAAFGLALMGYALALRPPGDK